MLRYNIIESKQWLSIEEELLDAQQTDQSNVFKKNERPIPEYMTANFLQVSESCSKMPIVAQTLVGLTAQALFKF